MKKAFDIKKGQRYNQKKEREQNNSRQMDIKKYRDAKVTE